jgi:hypothetical protein
MAIDRPNLLEINMPLRMVLIAFACLCCSATVQAAQSGGRAPGGTNFSCNREACTCDNTAKDCHGMEDVCDMKTVSCSPNFCTCTPARTNSGQTKPKPGAPVRVPPTSPINRQ